MPCDPGVSCCYAAREAASRMQGSIQMEETDLLDCLRGCFVCSGRFVNNDRWLEGVLSAVLHHLS